MIYSIFTPYIVCQVCYNVLFIVQGSYCTASIECRSFVFHLSRQKYFAELVISFTSARFKKSNNISNIPNRLLMCSLQRSPFPDCWTSPQRKLSSTRLKLLSSGSLRSETVCIGVSVWRVCITYRVLGCQKGKSLDQRRRLGMQTTKEKITSLWESFVLSAITSMCAPV